MRMILIPEYNLPSDWLNRVDMYDITKLHPNNQRIVNKLKNYIKKYKECALHDYLVQDFILHFVHKEKLSYNLDDLPTSFVDSLMDEIGYQKGYQFSLKLISLFEEIQIYDYFIKQGYSYTNISRAQDSTDLIMQKDNQTYDIQIKYKESNETFTGVIQHYIQGMSMIDKYKFLRGREFRVQVLKKSLSHSDRKKAWQEVDSFLNNGVDSCSGEYISIKPSLQFSRHPIKFMEEMNGFSIKDELIESESIKNLVQKIILDRIIRQLSIQYENRNKDNVFNGVIVWDIAFNTSSDFNLIEKEFRESIKLPYDLIVVLKHRLHGKEKYKFVLKKIQS